MTTVMSEPTPDHDNGYGYCVTLNNHAGLWGLETCIKKGPRTFFLNRGVFLPILMYCAWLFFFELRSFSPHSHALCTEILRSSGIEPRLAELSLKASNQLTNLELCAPAHQIR
jgi:hypothetical protein